MNKTWAEVLVASLFEVGWVIGMKHATGVLECSGTLVAIFLSFYFLMKASRVLPVGTVYAVFVGLGTAGTVLAEILLFGTPVQLEKIALIMVLLIGVIGLKLISDEKKEVKDI